jgi:nucleoside-diphosphate-sugar epimerase
MSRLPELIEKLQKTDRQARGSHAGCAHERHILVVGGAGYIGSVLVRRLITHGYRVTVLDRLIYGHGSTLYDLIEMPNFSFVYGDFCDPQTATAALDGITDVILLAALVGDPICRQNPDLAIKINQQGTMRFIDRLASYRINRFIFTSTCSNYGLRTNDEYATEKGALNPQSLYAETKVSIEQYILDNLQEFDFCPTILRLATAYGISSRMRFDLTISEFTRDIVMGKELIVFDENTWRPYCHVADISNAIIKILESPETKMRGEVFNVGSSDENYTKKMIVNQVLNIVPSGKIQYMQGGSDPRNYRVSFSKIASVLGFENAHSVSKYIPRLTHAIRSGLFDDLETRRNFFGNYVIDNLQ